MSTAKLYEGLIKVEGKDRTLLGIETYIPASSFALTKLSGLSKIRPLIIRGQTIEEWKPVNFTEHEKRVILTGPFLNCIPLKEVLEDKREKIFPYIVRLANALKVLQKNDRPLPPIHSGSIFFIENDGILMLPPELTGSIKSHQIQDVQIERYEVFNHPDLQGEKNACYSLAVILYMIFTGDYPYFSASDEELHQMQRDRDILAPKYRNPEIKKEISDLVYRQIRKPDTVDTNLKRWSEVLNDMIREGFNESVSSQEKDRLYKQGRIIEERFGRSYSRKRFVQRNWKIAAIITVVVVLAATIPITIISNVLKPRVTAGFPPRKVVETFYTSITEFDHATMEDCVIENAGKGKINEAINLFVISRQRLSVERRTGFIDVNEWKESGRPAPPPDSSIYGVSDLEIELEEDTENIKTYLVSYEKWSPLYPEEDEINEADSRLRSQFRLIRERVFLRQDGEDWVIFKIEELEDEFGGVVPEDS